MRRLSRAVRDVLCAAALVLSACGDQEPGLVVTEADPVASRSGVDPDVDTLSAVDTTLADTVAVDTSAVAADSVAAPPDFDAFWPAFQAAVRTGNVDVVARLARFEPGGAGLDESYTSAFTEPFRSGVLALRPRDFRHSGTARDARVVVGYDADGRVVPQDEADRDEAIRLRFDVVDGAYRWVDLETDG